MKIACSNHRYVAFAVCSVCLTSILLPSSASVLAADDVKPLAVAEIKHIGPVDFEKEILPILRRNCLACHNATKAQSELILETPKSILKGGAQGEGGLVPGKADESLVFVLAAHRDEPVMPPSDNTVGAKDLTPEELGLLKLWINEGAKGEVTSGPAPIRWQPLPPGFNSIYAVGVSPDGRMAVAARANQVFVYNLASRQEVGRLTDPEIMKSGIYTSPGVAHIDLVQSLAFSPDGERLASGAFRSVNIWRRPHNVRAGELAAADAEVRSLAVASDRKLVAIGEVTGKIHLYEIASGKRIRTLTGHEKEITGMAFSADGARLLSASLDQSARIWNTADGQEIGKLVTPTPVTAAIFVLDDAQIATAGTDNVIRTWPTPVAQPAAGAPAPQPLKQMQGNTGMITSLTPLGPKGAHLLSGSLDGVARRWDAQGGNEVGHVDDAGAITTVAARVDGKRIVTSNELGKAKLSNLENGQPVAELVGDSAFGSELDNLRYELELARRHVLNAKLDFDAAVKRKKEEQENVYAAVVEVAKTDIDAKKKAAAVVKPVADRDAALAALTKLKADLAAAEANKKKLEDPAAQATDDAKKQAEAAFNDATAKVKAAEAELVKLETPAKTATDEKTTAEQAFVAAKRTVERAAEEVVKVTAAIPQAKAVLDQRKQAEKAAQDKVASVERAIAARAMKLRDLEAQKVSIDRTVNDTQNRLRAAIGDALGGAATIAVNSDVQQKELEKQLADTQAKLAAATDEAAKVELTKLVAELTAKKDAAVAATAVAVAAVKTATDIQVAAAKVSVDASLALDAARAAARDATTQSQVLLQQATDQKTAADKDFTDAEALNTASLAAQDAANKALTAAQEKLKQAADDAAKTLATAEVTNTTQKKQIADEDATQAATIRAAATAAKAASEKQLTDAQAQGKQIQDTANQALAAAQAAYNDALAKRQAADAAAGGVQAQLQTVQQLKAAADAPLAELRKPMRSVALSPSGVQLAIVGDDQQVHLFNSETGEPIDSIGGQGAELVAAAFVGENRLLTVGRNKSLVIWDTLPQWSLERRIGSIESPGQFVDRVTALAFSPDGKFLATGGGEASRSGELKLWDVESGNLVRAVPNAHSDSVFAIEFSPDGKYLATGGADRFMKVFDVATGTLVKTFEGHTQHVLGVSWRADGRQIATAGADKVVKIWDFNSGEQARTFAALGKEVTAVQYLGTLDSFVVSAGDKSVSLRNGDGGIPGSPTFAGSTDYVFCVRASKAGKAIVAGGQDSVLRVWNGQGATIINFDPPPTATR